MPNLTNLVADEKARLESMLQSLERNYSAVCEEPAFAELETHENVDFIGDQLLLTTAIHSAMRPFFANDLQNGTAAKKRAALTYILNVIENSLDLIDESMSDFQGQLHSFVDDTVEHKDWVTSTNTKLENIRRRQAGLGIPVAAIGEIAPKTNPWFRILAHFYMNAAIAQSGADRKAS